jgi:hypothetical protein
MDKAKRITEISDSQGHRRHSTMAAPRRDSLRQRPSADASGAKPKWATTEHLVPVPALPRRAPAPPRSHGAAAAAPFLAVAWNGSWNDAPGNPSAAGAVSAMTRAIRAASAFGARGLPSCKRQVSGSIPLTGSPQVREGKCPPDVPRRNGCYWPGLPGGTRLLSWTVAVVASV